LLLQLPPPSSIQFVAETFANALRALCETDCLRDGGYPYDFPRHPSRTAEDLLKLFRSSGPRPLFPFFPLTSLNAPKCPREQILFDDDDSLLGFSFFFSSYLSFLPSRLTRAAVL